MIGALIAKRKAPEGVEALNRHDIDAFLKDWADDATWVYPGNMQGISGTFTGKDEIRAWFQRYFEQVPSVHFTIQHVAVHNLFDVTGTNFVAIHWEAEATSRSGVYIQNSGFDAITIKRGKIVHLQEYIFDTGETFRAFWGTGQ